MAENPNLNQQKTVSQLTNSPVVKVRFGQNTQVQSGCDLTLLVLASLVLEPDADDARRQPGHLHQLLLHERVRPGVGHVAALQQVQLLLGQHGPHPAGAVPPLLLACTWGGLSWSSI